MECKKCKRTLPESMFLKDSRNKSGYFYRCKECLYSRKKEPEMLLRQRYSGILNRLKNIKTYKDRKCNFTVNEFVRFGFKNKSFWAIYKQWEKSKYVHKLTPTVDRVNNNFGYSLDNIQFLTKEENSRKRMIELPHPRWGK